MVCYQCTFEVDEDDAVWVDPATGQASTGDGAAPFHVGCAPPQEG